MKIFLISLLFLLGASQALTQETSEVFYYNHQFTKRVDELQLDVRLDSLENYVLTNKQNKYLPKANLYLVNSQTGDEFIVIFDRGSSYPHITLSAHITNLMDNQEEHTLAFYSLDDLFILNELHADWATDAQFVPKDHREIMGYARSFYHRDNNIQVTLILLAEHLPLLSTPRELQSIRFQP